jgi:hypothetical protein
MGCKERNNGISTDKVSKRNKQECLQLVGIAACHLMNGNNTILRIYQYRTENVKKEKESRTRDVYKKTEELKTIKLLNKKLRGMLTEKINININKHNNTSHM